MAARRAGIAEHQADRGVIVTPSTTDHISTADGTGVSVEMIVENSAPSAMPTMPPTDRQRDRLGQHLRHDVAALGAERLAQPDLARPLAHHHQHDVHDHDAADQQRQADDADQQHGDAGGGLLEDASTESDATMPKLSGSAGLRPRSTRSATRVSSFARSTQRRVARLDHQLQRLARAEQLLIRAERDHHELVERLAERRALLLADADHRERHARDPDLSCRAGRPPRTAGRRCPSRST